MYDQFTGPMPSENSMVKLAFPQHIYVTTIERRPPDQLGSEDDDDEEEDGDEPNQFFVYHSIKNTRRDHMMSSEPKQVSKSQIYILYCIESCLSQFWIQ